MHCGVYVLQCMYIYPVNPKHCSLLILYILEIHNVIIFIPDINDGYFFIKFVFVKITPHFLNTHSALLFLLRF